MDLSSLKLSHGRGESLYDQLVNALESAIDLIKVAILVATWAAASESLVVRA